MDDLSSQPQVPLQIIYPSTVSPRFDIGLIFADSFRLLRNGLGQFAAIFLLIQVPLQLVQLLALPSANQPQGDLGNTGNVILAAVFFGFLGLFATLNVMTAARYQVARAPKVFYEVFLHSMVKFPTAVFTAIILGVVVFAGVIALIIPGIVFYIFGCCCMQAIAITDRRVIASLTESYELVKGNWWNVFAVQGILLVMLMVVTFPLLIIDTILVPPLLIKVPIYLIMDVLGLIINLVNVMMFYNLLAVRAHRDAGA
jgi:hypothetical protein